MKMNKQWIALHSVVSGQIEIDAGATTAIIQHGKVFFLLVLQMCQDFSKLAML